MDNIRSSSKSDFINHSSYSTTKRNNRPRKNRRSSGRRPPWFTPAFLVGTAFSLICVTCKPLLAVSIIAPIAAMIFVKTVLLHKILNRPVIEITLAMLAGCTALLALAICYRYIDLPIEI